MSNNLPDRYTRSGGIPVAKAVRSARRAEIEVYEYGLWAAVVAKKDEIDSMTTADAMECALGEELGLLERGLCQAGSDPAKRALVSSKAVVLSAINNRRISRRFG